MAYPKQRMALKLPLVSHRLFKLMNKSTGFTLIELLVAVLVLSVGLLGLAGLQVTGLKNNQNAYYRSQATQLAYDMGDRMRANVIGASTYTSNSASTAITQPTCITTTGCTPQNMALNDLFEWNSNLLTAGLPMVVGTITVVTTTTTPNVSIYTITIKWDDNRDFIIDINDPSFSTSFQLQ